MRPELERRLAVLVEPLARAVLDGVCEFESEPDRVRVDLAIVPVFVDERPLIGLAGFLDWRSSGRLSAIVRSSFFTGAAGEQLLIPGERRWPADRLVILGLGVRAELDDARARELASRCVDIATGLGSDSVLIALPSIDIERGIVEVAFDSLLDAISSRAVAVQSEPEPEPEPDPEPESEPESEPEPERAVADEPSGNEPSSSDSPVDIVPPAAPESQPEPEQSEPELEPRWWVVADEAVVARLRRVRSGPPRAARGGPSLYT